MLSLNEKRPNPKEIVAELDKYIVGQEEAKKYVSIALVNRYIRTMLDENLRDEITPKNIIMIGSTGVGKTEIARRLAKLIKAPFIKVEATKYTEVGYVGRDVESMIKDLMNISVNMVKNEMYRELKKEAQNITEEILLNIIFPHKVSSNLSDEEKKTNGKLREHFKQQLLSGELDNKVIEIDMPNKVQFPTIEVISGGNLDDVDKNIGNIFTSFFDKKKKKKSITVKKAREIILNEELEKLVDQDNIVDIAKSRVENMGIVFIDEIDKIATTSRVGNDVSREGVQRDILPIIEGSKVNTKYGIIDTSHILFIAAGAFHISKPSDLIPELQGRFPIKVELKNLSKDDFVKILKHTENSIINQYIAMLKIYEIKLNFTNDSIEKIASIAFDENLEKENLGARRLFNIMEKLLSDLFFEAEDLRKSSIKIDSNYVEGKVKINEKKDLNYYII